METTKEDIIDEILENIGESLFNNLPINPCDICTHKQYDEENDDCLSDIIDKIK